MNFIKADFVFLLFPSDASPRCHLSVHGAAGQSYGAVDRPGRCHCQQRLPVVYPGITQE